MDKTHDESLPEATRSELVGADDSYQKDKETIQFRESRTPGPRLFWLSICFDGLLFIATSTYAYVAYHQWRVMNNQANLMSQQLESTKRSVEQTQEMLNYARQQSIAANVQTEIAKEAERPYVVIKEISLENVSANAQPSYVVVYENSGKTTARKLSVTVVYELRTSPLPDNPAYPEPSGVVSMVDLGAGGQGRVTDTARLALKRGDIDALKQGRAWLYVYGVAKYSDGHGQEYVMKFCTFYNPSTGITNFCAQHNNSSR
jgi:hypothetical protein